jgi:hypothetical protein
VGQEAESVPSSRCSPLSGQRLRALSRCSRHWKPESAIPDGATSRQKVDSGKTHRPDPERRTKDAALCRLPHGPADCADRGLPSSKAQARTAWRLSRSTHVSRRLIQRWHDLSCAPKPRRAGWQLPQHQRSSCSGRSRQRVPWPLHNYLKASPLAARPLQIACIPD